MISTSTSFLHEEQEVHMRSSWELGDVWDDHNNLNFQAVQELFQLGLICRHAEIETMNPIFVG